MFDQSTWSVGIGALTNYAVANEDPPIHADFLQLRLVILGICVLLSKARLGLVRARRFLGRFPVVLPLGHQRQQNGHGSGGTLFFQVVKELLLEICVENDCRNYEYQSTHERSDADDVFRRCLPHVFAPALPFGQGV
jgi:hypothetical protein